MECVPILWHVVGDNPKESDRVEWNSHWFVAHLDDLLPNRQSPAFLALQR